MPDYSKCVIYKLQCNDREIKEIYVGSTCNINRRKNEHKSCCNNENSKNYNSNVYKFIRENGNWENWEMIPIEKYPCKDKIEKFIRERYFYDKLKATLNTINPNRNYKERRQRIETKEQIRKTERERYKKLIPINCECGGKYKKVNKWKHERTKIHINFMNQK